jgi:ATP-dependent RNA helicase TDRD12
MNNLIKSDFNLNNKKTNDSYLNRNIFINSPNIDLKPFKNLTDSPIHAKLKDYFHINGYHTINEFEGYLWKSILYGLDVLAVSSSEIDTELNNTVRKRKNKVVTFFSPVLTLMLKLIERENEAHKESLINQPESGKVYEYKRKNGPRLLIICSSCKNAQKIYEFIKSVLMNDTNLLKVILLQGGANDTTFDVKLSNGCDILICATPYCLLRMLGNGKTNFERLEFFVIDEANIVLDKYGKQVQTLMDSYANFLKIQIKKKVAQFILFSSTWSNKLKDFVSCFFTDETILFESKLEATYFGNVNHIVHEVDSIKEKVDKLIKLIETNEKNSILITMNESVSVHKLQKYLKKKGFHAQVVEDQTDEENLSSISNQWLEFSSTKQLILICSQLALTFLKIRNATCVIHFDFPQTKKHFSESLWTMHHNFKMLKNNSNKLTKGSGDSNDDPPQQWLDLQSHILFTKDDVEFSEGLLKFLKRTGVDEHGLPKLLIETANRSIEAKQEKQSLKRLCPLVKSYGECLSSLMNCEYRHFLDTNFDSLRVLIEDSAENKLYVPNEGHIKVSLIENKFIDSLILFF